MPVYQPGGKPQTGKQASRVSNRLCRLVVFGGCTCFDGVSFEVAMPVASRLGQKQQRGSVPGRGIGLVQVNFDLKFGLALAAAGGDPKLDIRDSDFEDHLSGSCPLESGNRADQNFGCFFANEVSLKIYRFPGQSCERHHDLVCLSCVHVNFGRYRACSSVCGISPGRASFTGMSAPPPGPGRCGAAEHFRSKIPSRILRNPRRKRRSNPP